MAQGRSSLSSRRHRHDHKPHVSQFRSRLETIKKQHPVHRLGDHTPSSEDYFVPESKVHSHLLGKRYIHSLLQDVTDLRPPPPGLIETIHNQCSIIFCILLEIGEPEYIERYAEDDDSWDRSLPFSAKPTYLPDSVWEEFSHVQRRFKPKELGATVLSFDLESIVPYTSVVRLDGGGNAQIYKVTLHNEYDNLQSQREAALRGEQEDEVDVCCMLEGFKLTCAEQSDKEYAVKVYKGRHAEKYFLAETKIFETIRGNKHKPYPTGLIEYFGAYKSSGGEVYCIVLELATGGSLRQMFDSKLPPTTGREIYKFWKRLFELFQGLTSLHELQNQQSSEFSFMQCVHHDIHSGNIIMAPNDKPHPQHYCLNYRYVLADLGHASTVSTPDASIEVQVPDPKAGREYAAPEVCATSEFESTLTTPVTAAVDLFSLGAVLLEAAVWIVRGPAGVKEFREKRTLESQAAGADSARFHNCDLQSPQLLDVVEDYITGKGLKRHIQDSDTTTGRVLETVIERLLQPEAKYRPSARIALRDAERLLHHSKSTPTIDTSLPSGAAERGTHSSTTSQWRPQPDGRSRQDSKQINIADLAHEDGIDGHKPRDDHEHMTVSQSAHPPDSVPVPQADVSGTPSSLASPRLDAAEAHLSDPYINANFVTIHEVLTYKQNLGNKFKQLTSHATLRGMHEKNRLQNRDMIFLVDDSYRMGEEYKISILNTFEAMLFIALDVDPNGVEVYFTSDTAKHQHRHAKKLLELMENHTYRNQTDMKESLSKLLAHCKDRMIAPKRRSLSFRPQARGTSIYVLTDGIWGSGNDVEPVIVKCVDFLCEHSWTRDHLCIQFITFGQDQEGLARIQNLDDLKTQGKAPLDMVDAESHEGSFWKMLLGALDPAKDKTYTYKETAATDCG